MSTEDDPPDLTRGPDTWGPERQAEWVPRMRKPGKLTHADVALAGAFWLEEHLWPIVAVEVSWSVGRVDVLAVRPRAGRVAVIEAKVSRSDLVRDLRSGKACEGYRTHADALWFAVPAELVPLALERVPAGIGILEAGWCGDQARATSRRPAARMVGVADAKRAERAVLRAALSHSARWLEAHRYRVWPAG